MTTEHSTYTYEGGEQETVTLLRGRFTPAGHALLKIAYSDGGTFDCYVDLAWLRGRADHLARQRPEGADLIDALLFDMGVDEKRDEVADYIAARLNVSPKEDR